MPRYHAVWLEIARHQQASFSAEIREQVDARIEQLLENPRLPEAGYDELTDQWTTIYGDGACPVLVSPLPTFASWGDPPAGVGYRAA